MAAGVAQRAGGGQLVLFHHDPSHGDEVLAEMEERAKASFPNSVLAREGLTLKL